MPNIANTINTAKRGKVIQAWKAILLMPAIAAIAEIRTMTCNRKIFIAYNSSCTCSPLVACLAEISSLVNSAFLGFVLLHNPRHNDKNDGHYGNCDNHLHRHIQSSIGTKFIYNYFDFLKNLTIAAHIKGKETKIKRPIRAINSFHLISQPPGFYIAYIFASECKAASQT
jgi:hypothetical protein